MLKTQRRSVLGGLAIAALGGRYTAMGADGQIRRQCSAHNANALPSWRPGCAS